MKFQVFRVFRAGEDATTGEPKFGSFAATGAHGADVAAILVAYFAAVDPENAYEVRVARD